ncbi:hypothetical protein Pint_22880 [Pistacia integerrima]|uniref:Uncharacterized protein n=2 Tax=Pistacia integerrima TaxID=434235 RepID=A0ACC0YIE7_9ROSI|nr:hypothetical protein Pint_22884 [Pistacia integerrima]KAJ0037988.1 hypothetical protein Pint_22880 [Pistacia integerrima]
MLHTFIKITRVDLTNHLISIYKSSNLSDTTMYKTN